MDTNPLEYLRRSNEEQYFLKKEKKLLEDLRRDAGRRSERTDLAEATGIADEEVLRELQGLGYSRETVKLFDVVPLLQVAWTDGFVTSQERELIVGVARTHNVPEGTAGDVQLQEWLRDKPSEQFFTRTNRIISTLLMGLASEERSASSDRLVALCTDVASASGGFLGLGKISDLERLAIEKAAAELERSHPVGVANVVARKGEASRFGWAARSGGRMLRLAKGKPASLTKNSTQASSAALRCRSFLDVTRFRQENAFSETGDLAGFRSRRIGRLSQSPHLLRLAMGPESRQVDVICAMRGGKIHRGANTNTPEVDRGPIARVVPVQVGLRLQRRLSTSPPAGGC